MQSGTDFIVIVKHSFRIPCPATDNRENTLDLQKQDLGPHSVDGLKREEKETS